MLNEFAEIRKYIRVIILHNLKLSTKDTGFFYKYSGVLYVKQPLDSYTLNNHISSNSTQG